MTLLKNTWKAAKNGNPFFRSGKIGSWEEELAPEVARQIERDHGEMMKKFGYESHIAEVA